MEKENKEPVDKKTNYEKKSDSKYDFIRKAVFLSFWLILAIVIAVYLIFNGGKISDAFQGLLKIAEPIVFGLIIGYILNPSVKFFEEALFSKLTVNMKNRRKAKSLNRGLAITLSLLIFLLIITLLLNMIIPELYNCILNLVNVLPAQVQNFTEWFKGLLDREDTISTYLQMGVDRASEYFLNWLKTDFISSANTAVSSLTIGVFEALKTAFNLFIGLIVSIYVLISKEHFTGQAKKICYSILKPNKANILLKTVRKSNNIFISFLSGKLIEAVIIGIICFIGMSILNLPYVMLISVIVGVTNIIPFVGPYIGGIPSILLIVLEDPIKGLTFTIFFACLYQLDGNLIGPKILGDSIGLSPFWIIFAILVGGGLFGFPGLLIGVPTFAVLYYIIDQLVTRKLKKRNLPLETGDYIYLKKMDVESGEPVYYTKATLPDNSIFKNIFKKKSTSEDSEDAIEDTTDATEDTKDAALNTTDVEINITDASEETSEAPKN